MCRAKLLVWMLLIGTHPPGCFQHAFAEVANKHAESVRVTYKWGEGVPCTQGSVCYAKGSVHHAEQACTRLALDHGRGQLTPNYHALTERQSLSLIMITGTQDKLTPMYSSTIIVFSF